MNRPLLAGALTVLLLTPTLAPCGEADLTTSKYRVEPERFDGLFSLAPWGQLVFRPEGSELDAPRIDAELPDFGATATPRTGEGNVSEPPPGTWSGGVGLDTAREWVEQSLVPYHEGEDTDSTPAETESAGGRVLLVRAPRAVQTRAAKLLEAIDALATEEIAVQCALVPVNVLEAAAPDWAATGPLVAESAFDAMLQNPRTQLVSVTARRGAKATATSREARAAIVAQEVNQTGVIPVTNPVVKTVPTGFQVELRAASVENGERVWLRLVAGFFRGSLREFDPEAAQFGALELPTVNQTLVATTVIVPAGKPAILGLSELQGGVALLVRTRPRSDRARLTRDVLGDGTLWLASIPDLVGADERTWPSPPAGPPEAFSPWYREPCDVIREALYRAESFDVEEGIGVARSRSGFLLAWGRSTQVGLLQKGMRELEAEAHRAASVVVELWDLPRARALGILEAADRGELLPADWTGDLAKADGVKRRRVAATAAHGETAGLFDAEVATYFVGSDQVSGGTGFAIVERSQPKLATCGTGGALWLRADFNDDEGAARLRVEAADALVEEVRLVEAVFPNLQSAVTDAGQAPVTNTVLKLELPKQRVTHFAADITVPLERDAILQARLDGERATLLVARVRRVP